MWPEQKAGNRARPIVRRGTGCETNQLLRYGEATHQFSMAQHNYVYARPLWKRLISTPYHTKGASVSGGAPSARVPYDEWLARHRASRRAVHRRTH